MTDFMIEWQTVLNSIFYIVTIYCVNFGMNETRQIKSFFIACGLLILQINYHLRQKDTVVIKST